MAHHRAVFSILLLEIRVVMHNICSYKQDLFPYLTALLIIVTLALGECKPNAYAAHTDGRPLGTGNLNYPRKHRVTLLLDTQL